MNDPNNSTHYDLCNDAYCAIDKFKVRICGMAHCHQPITDDQEAFLTHTGHIHSDCPYTFEVDQSQPWYCTPSSLGWSTFCDGQDPSRAVWIHAGGCPTEEGWELDALKPFVTVGIGMGLWAGAISLGRVDELLWSATLVGVMLVSVLAHMTWKLRKWTPDPKPRTIEDVESGMYSVLVKFEG